MSKKKTAKRAFISSLLVLAMCFTMLAGTTFAWFTDSVSSANNIIKSGKLDMDVEYYDAANTAWKPLDSSVALFDDNALFEPGYVQVAYIKIANIGDLAFTYHLSANIVSETKGKNQAGAEFALSDYLKFGTAEVADIFAADDSGREDAIAAVDGTATALKDINLNSSDVLYPAGSTAGDSETGIIAVVIYMPTTVGNEANYGDVQPVITLGLNALATQYTFESDSFSDQYDADAYAASVTVTDPTTETEVTKDNVTVTIPANAAEAGDEYDLVVSNVGETTVNNETTVELDISLYKNDVKVEGTTVYYPVEINVGANKDITAVTHNGSPINTYNYNPATGILSFSVNSFSPFTYTYVDVDVPTANVTSIAPQTIELWGVHLTQGGDLDISGGLISMGDYQLAKGVSFEAPDGYTDWNTATADFIISFNKNLTAIDYEYDNQTVQILPVVPVGKFGDDATSFWTDLKSKWIPCPLATDSYVAGTEIALLESVIGASVNYSELRDDIKEFSGGIVFLQDVGEITVTVSLILTKDGVQYIAGTQNFTINSADYVA